MNEYIDIGKRLRENRDKLGMTQGYLAAILHVDVHTIANWEHGRSVPSAFDLIEMRTAFHESIEEILRLEKEEP
ncbi:MAG: helix-turn-helix domain-containing protein [Streptococcaceae bacterium]|jgi:transcriptional regulator with XRE-family HTH domain|nr:helix-turn-helix domain-containing protein [Streptococcaceae bacterium]